MEMTHTNNSIEEQRLSLQNMLDAEKSQHDRNRLGQFATPTILARDIVTYSLELLPAQTPVRFLDPAIGTGSFYSALLAAGAAPRIVTAEGYEVDPHY
jgi:predicted RNA methylase